MTLNGNWKLYYCPHGEGNIHELHKLPSIPAKVPGNVELDLSAAGILPKELFKGMNILEGEKFETYEWWYEKSFTAPERPDDEHKAILHFGGVDCYAEYYLNGEKFGESDNMLVHHDFELTDKINWGGENSLHIHIGSAIVNSNATEVEPAVISYTWHTTSVSVNSRKAPHSYGWDIMPRAVSAGIWREVELNIVKKYDFR